MSRVQNFKTPLGWLAYGILLPTLLGILIVHETGHAVLDQPVLNGMTFRVSNIPISIHLVKYSMVSPVCNMKSPLHSHYTPITLPLPSHYTPITFPLHSHYTPITFPLHSHYTPINVHSHYIPITFPLHSHYIPVTFPLHSRYIPIISLYLSI